MLSEEIELLKIYVELEALRFDHSFSYHFEIDENLDIDAHEIPMLLVQPYIENAIIHGLMPKKGDKRLLYLLRILATILNVLLRTTASDYPKQGNGNPIGYHGECPSQRGESKHLNNTRNGNWRKSKT